MTPSSESDAVFPLDECERPIPARFEAIARAEPDRPAVVEGGRAITYGQLNARANCIAHAILRRRGPGEEPVAVLLGKGARLVAAFMGIVKAGKIYTPLDPSHPVERTRLVLDDSGAACLLTDAHHRALAAALDAGGQRILDVEADSPSDAAAAVDPGLPLSGDTLATIIYTSGSTGRPKGVLKDHRSTLHNARKAALSTGITGADRVFFVQSASVMGGVRDMVLALSTRALLVPYDLAALGLAPMAGAIRREQATIVNTVVTVFRHWVAGLGPDDHFPTVRVLKLGSEPLAPTDLEAFRRHFGERARLWVGCGSTETGNLTHVMVGRDTPVGPGPRIAVGRCFDEMEVLIVDDAGQPLPPGEVGEVWVRTRYMARGYWRRPEQTAAVFLPDPEGGDRRRYRTGDLGRLSADGSLELLGRRDSMVKVRGQRVELGEIEAALLALPDVRQAVVVAAEPSPGDARLVAYVAPAGGAAPTASDLRRGLGAALPAHMVPERYVVLPALPSTPQGKVDRRALPQVVWTGSRAESFVAPRTPVERALAAIWSAALGIEAVGVTDHFGELGGHSLIAGRITEAVAERFGVLLPVSVLLATPTVRDMAVAVTEHMVARVAAGDRHALPSALDAQG